MSRARAWGIVEGSNHDVPFYESLLIEGAGIEHVEVIQASDLEVDGSSAGGKAHALKLKSALESSGSLEQENLSTKIDVIFFLDRDDDEYHGELSKDTHVAYTHYADVEAEIVAHSSLPTAISRTFSLTRRESQTFAAASLMEQLTNIWSEWISLRLASGECGWSDTRFSQPSQINFPAYGPVDDALVHKVCAGIEKACPSTWPPAVGRAKKHVKAEIEADCGARLLKGKWIASFVIHTVKHTLEDSRKLPTVSVAQLMAACSMSVDYTRVWYAYSVQLGTVLSR